MKMVVKGKILMIFCISYCYYGSCEYLRLREGAKCVWRGLNGTCRQIHQCPGVRHTINNGINIDIADFQAICAYRDKEPVICCADCYPDLSSDEKITTFNPHLGTLRKTGQKASDQFLNYLDKLEYPCKLHLRAEVRRYILEGDKCYGVTESHSGFQSDGVTYPRNQALLHTAVLGFGANFDSAQWLCGGSVISENYILSSANCTTHPELGQVKFIAMGMFNTTDPEEKLQRYNVEKVITHPEYQKSSKYHDIALIKTDDPIVFNKYVLPSNIFTDGKFDEKANVISWKAQSSRQGLPETLESVYSSSLVEFGELECSLFYPPHEQLSDGYNHTIQMCYGYKKKTEDACEGDNGGPLQNNWHTSSCGQTILGVTALSRTCGEAGGSGLYTRVRHYIPWIESIVWP